MNYEYRSKEYIAADVKKRVDFLKDILLYTGSKGFIFGNSGGKDCALCGILAKMATDNVMSVIMPCDSERNLKSDKSDAEKLCEKFKIDSMTVDLTLTKKQLLSAVPKNFEIPEFSSININPRLRMTTLYAIGQTMSYLVLGTGNRSERYMGYFTKWGDGAFDVSPISDLTASGIFEYLQFLRAPKSIIEKAPSAGLFDGQTDEKEMGVTYERLDRFLLNGIVNENDKKIIEKAHKKNLHKTSPTPFYRNL